MVCCSWKRKSWARCQKTQNYYSFEMFLSRLVNVSPVFVLLFTSTLHCVQQLVTNLPFVAEQVAHSVCTVCVCAKKPLPAAARNKVDENDESEPEQWGVGCETETTSWKTAKGTVEFSEPLFKLYLKCLFTTGDWLWNAKDVKLEKHEEVMNALTWNIIATTYCTSVHHFLSTCSSCVGGLEPIPASIEWETQSNKSGCTAN